MLRAAAAIQREDWGAARALYQPLVRDPQAPAEAWHGLGVVLLAQGDAAAARDAHERAVALVPQHPGFRFEFGRALFLLKRQRDAAHQFAESIRLEPKNPLAHWALAYLLHERGKKRSARRIVEAGLRHTPDAKILKDVVAGPQASTASPPPTAADPNAALIQQIMTLLGQSRHREARKLLTEAAAQGKRSATLKLLEAEVYKRMLPPDTANAIKAYEEALAMDPGNGAIYNDFGNYLQEEGLRYAPRAVELLEKARQLEPTRPEPALNLVSAYAKARRIPDARTLIEQILSGLAPEHPLRAQALTMQENLKKL